MPQKRTRPNHTRAAHDTRHVVERVQTGVRIEKRLLKVLKAFAELRDMSLGDLLEGIVLHAFDNKAPFSAESLKRIASLKEIYGLDLDASASHQLREKTVAAASSARKERRAK
jgi:predicted DNA-binding ribbon-helix-helix protein